MEQVKQVNSRASIRLLTLSPYTRDILRKNAGSYSPTNLTENWKLQSFQTTEMVREWPLEPDNILIHEEQSYPEGESALMIYHLSLPISGRDIISSGLQNKE